MAAARDPNSWIPWEEPKGGGIYTRDHRDPSFAYMGYKFQITDLSDLISSIHLAWRFAFDSMQNEYVKFVGNHLLDQGRINEDSTRSDVYFAFSTTSPQETKYTLHEQGLASVVSAYLRYLKTTLTFILPAHYLEYPKKFKIDLEDVSIASDIGDLVVRSVLPEIDALGFSDYPSLKKKCIALDIYPSSKSRDLKMAEAYIKRRNEILHFHPGAEFVATGHLRDATKLTERSMWASIRAFSRLVNSIERRAMKKYRVWTGYWMLAHHAQASGRWSDERLLKLGKFARVDPT